MKLHWIILSLVMGLLLGNGFAQDPAAIPIGGEKNEIGQKQNQSFVPGIYVGRYGYWKNMPVKVAYLTFVPGKEKKVPAKFSLCTVQGKVVFSGKPILMKNPQGVLAPVHKEVPKEQIYALNFSSFKVTGQYFIKVHGYGNSDLFYIGGDMPIAVYSLPTLKTFEEQSHMIGNDMKPLIKDSFLYTPLRYPVDTTP